MSIIIIIGVIITFIVWWQVGFTEALYTGGAVIGLFIAARVFGTKNPQSNQEVDAIAESGTPRTDPDVMEKKARRRERREAEEQRKMGEHAAALDEILKQTKAREQRLRTAKQAQQKQRIEDARLQAEVTQMERAASQGSVAPVGFSMPFGGVKPLGGASLFGKSLFPAQ